MIRLICLISTKGFYTTQDFVNLLMSSIVNTHLKIKVLNE